jgi:Ca2+-binding EF-hand superfamily protein
MFSRRLILASLAIAAVSAHAQTAPQRVSPQQWEMMQKTMRERFAAADKNADGRLTRDEAKGKMPRVYDNFATIDRDKKGYVTLKEIEDSLKQNVVVSGGGR